MVSVIIPTYHRSAYLHDALMSVQRQNYPTDNYEVIVVDNHPTGENKRTVQQVERQDELKIRYIEEPVPGLHHARHAGAHVAHGEYLAYIDDDVITPPGWLYALVRPFTDSHIGMVGGKVLPQWEASPPPWLGQFPPAYLSLLDYGAERQYGYAIHGCNLAIRRTVLYEVGGFHPDAFGNRADIWLRGDGEDGLQNKVMAAGYEILYEPDASVSHRIPAARLQVDYFYWRAFIQGISNSYSRIRQYPDRRYMMRHAFFCVFNGLRCYVHFLKQPTNYKMKADAWYWYGQGQHQLRVMLNRKLRQHVLQTTYI